MSKLPELENLALSVHKEVHATPGESHGYDAEDVMNAAVLLHALVMDVGAEYLLKTIPEEDAIMYSREWGENLHNQVLKMTGVDSYKFKEQIAKGSSDE